MLLKILFQKDTWGLDFHKNGKLLKTAYGKYSTEVFNDEALNIIENHNSSQVMTVIYYKEKLMCSSLHI